MVWCEERQDQAKERINVAAEDLAWEKRMTGVLMDKTAECEEHLDKIEDYLTVRWRQEEAAQDVQKLSVTLDLAPNVSQLPSNNGMVVASGSRSTSSLVQLACSPIPEVLIIPPTPQLAPLPCQPRSSSSLQHSPLALQTPNSAQVGDIKPFRLGHELAPVESTFKEPTTSHIVDVEIPLDNAVPGQSALGHI